MKPTITPTVEQLAEITETKNGQKVIAKAKLQGVTWYALADGSEIIEDKDGQPAVWPGGE